MPQVEQSKQFPGCSNATKRDREHLGSSREPKNPDLLSPWGTPGWEWFPVGSRELSTQLDLTHRMEEGAQRSHRVNGAEDQVQRRFVGGIDDLVDQSKVDKRFCALSQV